jgi:hypothetical protein
MLSHLGEIVIQRGLAIDYIVPQQSDRFSTVPAAMR